MRTGQCVSGGGDRSHTGRQLSAAQKQAEQAPDAWAYFRRGFYLLPELSVVGAAR